MPKRPRERAALLVLVIEYCEEHGVDAYPALDGGEEDENPILGPLCAADARLCETWDHVTGVEVTRAELFPPSAEARYAPLLAEFARCSPRKRSARVSYPCKPMRAAARAFADELVRVMRETGALERVAATMDEAARAGDEIERLRKRYRALTGHDYGRGY